ncbi:MAG TPA: arginine deiminase family protein [Sediminibacterium sp.]|jgi:arginine deiminase|uniref:arginine deiminase family protein n=1 Tax=Sediminibacterium sp. TaxID=1917865 RepID=UPI0008C740F6|nr:arginine deiminase family protein [Sediminibacterium sp.]OHC84220.1 MAG: amidinotransferase [Sphingobacteriia bacterium RIFOXYC2_FULL_35_18]OHC88828.1 MAG: amidinotransferase [Sphingobacteriia bacterium RIFOXYD2_FULL_35_12]OYY12153.1 MAG: amidinotransferase [Sphingobacteriia bacterium 35-36-14]OYZ55671.1 MAG: amidinotransferase [Sphingobacteriia bacterium 24-36-13]OZA65406.1 MAG: amidinotransferase [Sphingobacteriia bacterium 39-36-14]
MKVSVTSEIGTLKRLLVHSPDSGLGKVVPSKAQDWLFEDIVHLDTIRKDEYDYYTKILLYFLDPEKIKGKLTEIDSNQNNREFYKPEHEHFYKSDKVIELQWLLSELLKNSDIKTKLVSSVCAIEGCTYRIQNELLNYEPTELAKTLISGTSQERQLLFAPIPNFIFTRDIGITIKDHVLLNKPAKKARTREALLAKYIFFNHPLFADYTNKIIELSDSHHSFLLPKEDDERKITLEGGDIMVVSENHILVGVSERTSSEAAVKITQTLFEMGLMDKVTIVKIPKKRDYMHIDTVFTQVKRDVWVMLGNFSRKAVKHEDESAVERILEIKKEEKIKILQFHRNNPENPISFESLEDLLVDISKTDLQCKTEVRFIFSGNNEFPYSAREQWTDSCNLLALKEGVVLGYDRNDKTTEAFRNAGFTIIGVKELLQQLENNSITIDQIKDTFILMPSAELSRARGGFHCMSMPLWREPIN